MARDGEGGSGESLLTVLLAGSVNLLIAVLKLVAGLITGSGAMLSEAAHSVADTLTEIFLLTALRSSRRPADRTHPFGYGKARYFWSLLAAVSIFASGSMFAFYQGVTTVFGEAVDQTSPVVAYVVLAVAFTLESVSLSQAVRQTRHEAAEQDRRFRAQVRHGDDPTSTTVLFEDSAALCGVLLAFAGVGLHQLTGSSLWDGLASIAIGMLLAGVAFMLGRVNAGLLIGRQAAPDLVYAIRDTLSGAPEVDALVDLQTMLIGADSVLVCARVDFDDTLTAGDLERVCVRLAGELRELNGDVSEVFIEPVPRSDQDLRAAVLARYGGTPR
ncbi:cation diffusion facilitator family transporter [Actinokineospora iranica]|uniref:Cation diffusion facilitator family transporter n=1 Tax=Actinokineospora iranica TaxID=1271860 RepID=A0A1G6XHH8_9PSEU|nr:cation diffusion facilitator family transporter [Actinokineospora iranica]SDD76767.1 cation diffusion facilitator family transporter [Actinokineospora iranica]